MSETSSLRIDFVILICQGCKVERRFTCEPVLHGADDVARWLATQPTRCSCGAEKCDAKMHVMEQN